MAGVFEITRPGAATDVEDHIPATQRQPVQEQLPPLLIQRGAPLVVGGLISVGRQDVRSRTHEY